MSTTLACDVCGDPIVERARFRGLSLVGGHTHCTGSMNSTEVDVCGTCSQKIDAYTGTLGTHDTAPELIRFARLVLGLPG